MTTLEQLEFETKLEEAKTQIKLLWKCTQENKDRAVKWLLKIFGNILANPNVTKFHSINFAKMMKLFRNARPGLHILFAAGFKQTVDGSKIQIDPKYFNHLSKVLALLTKRLSEPGMVPTPSPPRKEVAKPSLPVKKKEQKKPVEMDIDVPKLVVPKQANPEYMDALSRGEAIVVMENLDDARKIVKDLNGAEIDTTTVTAEFFITADDKKRFAEASGCESIGDELAMDKDEPKSADVLDKKVEANTEITSKKVKISGLTANVTKASLNSIINKFTQTNTIKETYYKKKAARGEGLGGFEDEDDLLSQINAMKGNLTKLTKADLEGKTAEEKRQIMQEKREQYRRDKQKHATKESITKSANIREQRKAALRLKEMREQQEMEDLVRQRKKAKEREKREKERVRQKIKADKERRRKEREAREKAKAAR